MLEEYSTWRVARVFFDAPSARLGLREIGRRADLAHTALETHLERLMGAGIVEEEAERQGSRTYPVYVAETASAAYRLHKRLDVVHRIHRCGLIEHLEDHYVPDCVVLYGSAARGEDVEESDVDLFVAAGDGPEPELSSFEAALARSIQLHVRPDLKAASAELRNGLANGIVLYGYLRVIG